MSALAGTAAATAPSLAGHAWWIASRAAGLVALALVTGSVILGLTQAGRLTRRPGVRRKLAALHEQLAVTGLVAIAVHGITLLGDPWLNPGLSGISFPFTMAYRPLFTGIGIVAGYLAAILGLSFYVRRRIGPRLWRRAHQLTIVVYAHRRRPHARSGHRRHDPLASVVDRDYGSDDPRALHRPRSDRDRGEPAAPPLGRARPEVRIGGPAAAGEEAS